MNKNISLDTAAVLTDVNKRTLWRWINDKKLIRQENDKRGRAMLKINDIAPMFCIQIPSEDYILLTDSDNDDANAQSDLALLFLEQKRPDIAQHWLHSAANNQHSDAMHYLSELYLKGYGVSKCEGTALMWLAKAATQNHYIASKQLLAWVGVKSSNQAAHKDNL